MTRTIEQTDTTRILAYTVDGDDSYVVLTKETRTPDPKREGEFSPWTKPEQIGSATMGLDTACEFWAR